MHNDRLLTENDTKPLDCQTQQSDRGITKMPTIIDGLFMFIKEYLRICFFLRLHLKFYLHLACGSTLRMTHSNRSLGDTF